MRVDCQNHNKIKLGEGWKDKVIEKDPETSPQEVKLLNIEDFYVRDYIKPKANYIILETKKNILIGFKREWLDKFDASDNIYILEFPLSPEIGHKDDFPILRKYDKEVSFGFLFLNIEKMINLQKEREHLKFWIYIIYEKTTEEKHSSEFMMGLLEQFKLASDFKRVVKFKVY